MGSTSTVNAHTKDTIHPTNVQPSRRFNAKMAPAFRLFLAMIDGRK